MPSCPFLLVYFSWVGWWLYSFSLKTRYFSSALSFLKCILEAGARSHQVRAFPAFKEDSCLLPVSMFVGSQPLLTPTPGHSMHSSGLWKPLTCTNPQTDRNKHTKLKMKSFVHIQWVRYDPSIHLLNTSTLPHYPFKSFSSCWPFGDHWVGNCLLQTQWPLSQSKKPQGFKEQPLTLI